MAIGTDTTDSSVIHFPGELGHNPGGARTVTTPASKYVLQTASAAPTAAPVENTAVLVSDDIYYYDGDEWLGPYVLTT